MDVVDVGLEEERRAVVVGGLGEVLQHLEGGVEPLGRLVLSSCTQSLSLLKVPDSEMT
ncbi:hypothetical protein [Agromyces flavus]|uniref:hypothetical protein n=1 Tax=Agromyces flavus TaxID=589382 RepID=UPI00360C92E6